MSDSTRQVRIVRWEEPSLWNEAHKPLSLGCAQCADLELCGGLRQEAPVFNCRSFCECANPKRCNRVCPRNWSNFVARKREIGGFELGNVPRTQRIDFPPLPSVVPLIRNGADRQQHLNVPVVALPLFGIVQASIGKVRFSTRDELCRHFKISPDSFVIASGVSQDAPLEKWWKLPDRASVIGELKVAGVDLVTTPNFSMFTAVPRWDNFHGMKRIAVAWSEFQLAGMPAALHLNATSERDYTRWTDFIAERPEVTTLAFEFGTGAGYPGRIEQHVRWLCELGKNVDRPLNLILRGAQGFIGRLASHFARVVFIDNTSFIKTQKRYKAELMEDGRLLWTSSATLPGIALDALLAHNVRVSEQSVRHNMTSRRQFMANRGALSARGHARRRDKESAQVGALREIELPKNWR